MTDANRQQPQSGKTPSASKGGQAAPQGGGSRGSRPAERQIQLSSGRNIVPRDSVAGQALLAVITIMAFLACLTLGTVMLIRDTANGWQTDISREVTVQLRPIEGLDMDKATRDTSRLLLTFEGVSKVTALDDAATARLLEPWLGSGLSLEELPVPRLLTVTIADGGRPDFAAMREQLKAIPGASLDDHRNWVDRLTNMARATVVGGIIVFVLVMVATVLTVVFATRGAMAGNRSIIEVLHFVGADRRYIAAQFERHFLTLALKGALSGGLAAVVVFAGLGWWNAMNQATPEASQLSALFGSFSIGLWGYAGIILVALCVAFLASATSRLTVLRHVGILETYGGAARL